MLTLPEELMLLSLDDDGKDLANGIAFPFAMAAATVMELSWAGRLRVGGDDLEVVDPSPVGNAMLDTALGVILIEKRHRDMKYWVANLSGHMRGMREMVAAGLVARGILGVEEGRRLWVIRTRQFPTEDGREEMTIVERLRRAVLDRGAPDERTRFLASLVRVCGLIDPVFGRENRKKADAAIQALQQAPGLDSDALKAVQQAIDAVTASIAAATSAASVAATVGH